jgi:pimeloyl-ACP methyl ester carboxylesterase
VGIDPRGTNFSDQVQCFTDPAQQSKALEGLLGRAFPVTKAEEAATVASARAMGKGCSTTGRPLSGAMSTAQVARDMDVVRRAVGDTKLSFLGFSYGSYLGQVYANMFPDRVRAVAIDGVLDPIAWRGTWDTAHRPQTDRIRSADGAYKALIELLERCDAAGVRACSFAAGNPVRKYDVIAERLKKEPLVMDGGPAGPQEFGYDDLVAFTLSILYSSEPGEFLADMLTQLYRATAPAADRSVTAAARAAAVAQVRRLAAELAEKEAARRGWDFPYDNSFEAFASVLCTDGLNPRTAWSWSRAADAADRRAPYFGRYWAWASVQCAREAWTVRDEDAYFGPFTRHTAAPVLVVGNYWDPATNYGGAVTAARLLPNSRLLSSDNWGHTAYGTSDCATGAINAYLISLRLPAQGTVCHAPQPFTGGDRRTDASRQLPPVAPPLPPRPAFLTGR